MKKAIILILCLVLIAVVALVTTRYVTQWQGYSFYEISSAHMLPTLKSGDYVQVDKNAYNDVAPQLADIVTYTRPDRQGVSYIGRIVALGETTFELQKGQRVISGKLQPEPYLVPSMCTLPISLNFKPYAVPQGAVFIAADNRDDSQDSRYFGHVAISNITGKVIKIQ